MFLELFAICLTGLCFLFIGLLYKRHPPRKISWWYGYRTRRSMANQQIWDYANRIGAKMVLNLGLLLLVASILLYILLPFPQAMVVSIFVVLIGIGIGMFWCEAQLDKLFDKKGDPKDKT